MNTYPNQPVALFFFPALLLLSACAEQRPFKPLKPLTSYIDYQETQSDITVRARKLGMQDCTDLFGKDAAHLLNGRRALYPIQISITNHSDEIVVLKPENIGLPLVDYQSAAKRLQRSPGIHGFGSALGTITASAGIFAAGMLSIILAPPLFLVGVATCASTPFLILVGAPVAGTMRSSTVTKANRSIKKALKEHALTRSLIIDPGYTIETLVFVEKRHCKSEFPITVIQRPHPNESLEFIVTLS